MRPQNKYMIQARSLREFQTTQYLLAQILNQSQTLNVKPIIDSEVHCSLLEKIINSHAQVYPLPHVNTVCILGWM